MHCWSQCHHNKYRCRKTVEKRRCGISPQTNRNCDLPLTRLAPSLQSSSVSDFYPKVVQFESRSENNSHSKLACYFSSRRNQVWDDLKQATSSSYKISTQRVLQCIQFDAIEYLHFIKLHKKIRIFQIEQHGERCCTFHNYFLSIIVRDATISSLFIYWKVTLHVSGVVAPIIRST
jgi:hypothetical protein